MLDRRLPVVTAPRPGAAASTWPRARSGRGETALLGLVLAVLLAWSAFPVVLLAVHAARWQDRLTGADGLIGADGVLGADQLQYLAWIRDAGRHVLASDLFTLAPSGHAYLEPVFALSGLAWRAGAPLVAAYLLWKPLAAVALVAAAATWARRLLPDSAGERLAAVLLSLFLYTPLAALFSWAQLGGGRFRFQLYLLAYELLAANKLWGYVPSALALALVPAALLSVDRALRGDESGQPPRGGGRRRALVAAALAAGMASWLHPWQGITLIVVFAGLAAWRRLRGALALAVAGLAAALPLAYYYALGHADPAWRMASHYEVIPRLGPLVLVAGLGPWALIAAAGARRPGGDPIEQELWLWPAGCLVTYWASDAFAPHALQGLSFPLAVLAVRGWRRLRGPAWARAALPAVLGAAAIALATVPGLAYDARKFARTADNPRLVQYYLPRPDARALDWVAHQAPPGGVLAPVPLALVIPSQTGRAVWVGHGYWSTDYRVRAREANALFSGRLRPARARALVRASGARLLVADCRHRARLAPVLGPLLAGERRFGCATVYVLAG